MIHVHREGLAGSLELTLTLTLTLTLALTLTLPMADDQEPLLSTPLWGLGEWLRGRVAVALSEPDLTWDELTLTLS